MAAAEGRLRAGGTALRGGGRAGARTASGGKGTDGNVKSNCPAKPPSAAAIGRELQGKRGKRDAVLRGMCCSKGCVVQGMCSP